MSRRPMLSLIVPTRGRPEKLRRFLDSVVATAAHPERLEVILVVDADDPPSLFFNDPRLPLRRVVGSPGRTMGALNNAGFAASLGDHLMLLNDDVLVHTPGWDVTVLGCFKLVPDPFVLVHVNDTLIRDHLCTFPLVSRAFCELAGGICPTEYLRYRIDDHIEDVFNLLAVLGERRVFYLPDVVFEHTNSVANSKVGREYLANPAILAFDAPRFDDLLPKRKELALQILEEIEGISNPEQTASRRALLDTITDSFAIRIPGRQRVVRDRSAQIRELAELAMCQMTRIRDCARRRGCFGLAQKAVERLLRRRVR
jgi:glycosyltransferase involved in cell wall biosynthesis